MKKYLFLASISLFLIISGCNSKGIPVEYAKMCDKANDDKTVEVVGFLDNNGSAMCSNSAGGGPIGCSIRFIESKGAEKFVLAKITKGSWSSEIENVKDEGLKIRDDKSEFISRDQKVKVTASVMVFTPPPADPSTGCSLSVYKIEKQ